MRRMLAVRQHKTLERAADLASDGVELRDRPVFVVGALYRQDGTADLRQDFLNVPGAEFRMEPDVVPAAESAVHIGVMARHALPQIARLISRARRLDAGDRDVLDEDMGCFEDERAHRPLAAAGMDERDRGAVAVTDENDLFEAESGAQIGKREERFLMHVIDAAR